MFQLFDLKNDTETPARPKKEVKKMEEKVEAKTQVKPEKKTKTRMLLVLLFLVIVAIIGYIALRGQYLELLEIGENYTSVFWQNLTYKSVAFGISFVIYL